MWPVTFLIVLTLQNSLTTSYYILRLLNMLQPCFRTPILSLPTTACPRSFAQAVSPTCITLSSGLHRAGFLSPFRPQLLHDFLRKTILAEVDVSLLFFHLPCFLIVLIVLTRIFYNLIFLLAFCLSVSPNDVQAPWGQALSSVSPWVNNAVCIVVLFLCSFVVLFQPGEWVNNTEIHSPALGEYMEIHFLKE